MSYAIFLIALFVVIMVGGVIGVLRYQRLRREKILSDKTLFLKTHGRQVKVNFDSCDIVHAEYYDETEKGEKVKRHISIITFQTDQISGEKILFKTLPVFLPEDELRKLISQQKKTFIYYDPTCPGIHYFDVEFLLPFMIAESKI